MLWLSYLVIGWFLQLAILRVRPNASKDLEIVVPRQELAYLGRSGIAPPASQRA